MTHPIKINKWECYNNEEEMMNINVQYFTI